jgi:peptidoglycan/xylan/chitin deacetylase (PgdA/CDA1 family)
MKYLVIALIIFIGIFAVLPVFAQDAPPPPLPPVSCPILIYHSVRPYWSGDTDFVKTLITTPEVFEVEMKYFAEQGYTSVSFEQLASSIREGTPLPNKPIIFSFDDGWESQYTYAYPLLKKYGFTGTFYVYTNVIERLHFMTWDQVIAMSNDGMEIGCHSKSHPFLAHVDNDQLHVEILDSKQIIEEHIGKPVTTFAYPFGQYNEHVMEVVKDSGYSSARGVYPGMVHSLDSIFCLTGVLDIEDAQAMISSIEHSVALNTDK